jgi:hypothetical protein
MYLGAWSAGFVYEDWNATGFSRAAALDIQPLRVRSLTRLSYRLDRWMGDNTPRAYHLTNVVLHIANTGLVMGLCYALGLAPAVTLLTGVIFAVHPLQTEAVTYIAGRTEVLSAFWILLGCVAVTRRWMLATVLCFGLAVASKESAVIGVGLFGLVYLLTTPNAFVWTPRMARATVLLAVIVGAITVTVYRYEYLPGMRSPLPLLAYMRLQATAVWVFLGMEIFPRAAWLSVDHDFEIVPWSWQLAAGLGLLYAICTTPLLWLFRREIWRRAPIDPIFHGLAWAVIAIAPRFVMRIPEVINEHQLYLPHVGLAIALAQGAALTCTWVHPSSDAASISSLGTEGV